MGTYKEEILNSLILRKFKGKIMPFGKNKGKKSLFLQYMFYSPFQISKLIYHISREKKLKSLYSERL